MELITASLLALAGIIGAVTSAAVVPHSQYEAQDFESQEADLNRKFQSTEAQTARAFSASEAEKQRNFEEEMSSTQYQRAVNDLKAAGLNPASIGLGMNGASTPSVSAAQQGYVPVGSAAHSGIANTSYFSNMFSMAAQQALASDKNFMNETIARMYTNNARYMNAMTQQTKQQFNKAYQQRTEFWHLRDFYSHM